MPSVAFESSDLRKVLVHARTVHKTARLSPLAHDAPVQEYRGFHNLVMLLLFVNNLRLVIENYMKYGIRLRIPSSGPISPDFLRAAFACTWLLVPVAVILLIEKWAAYQMSSESNRPGSGDGEVEVEDAAATVLLQQQSPKGKVRNRRGRSSSSTAPVESQQSQTFRNSQHRLLYNSGKSSLLWTIQIICIASITIITNVYAYYYMHTPLITSLPCFWSVIVTMKMISYILVNAELHAAHKAGVSIPEFDPNEAYPKNLTVRNMSYFLMAPTLCYQPSYPRTERFRMGFFLKRLVELLTLMGMMWFITEQYSRPTLENSLRPFDELNFFALFERVLKLSIPSIYIWLCSFYAIFHSYLNLWAELLRFSDREFYKPWWNASTIAQYWRLWNMPVYTFFKRHVYVPFRVMYPNNPAIANLVAFFISAVGHEIVVGVPTHILQGWAFLGMIMQVPLIYLSEFLYKLEHRRHKKTHGKKQADDSNDDLTERPSNLGNYFFWISFCILGQPLCVLLYYRAYYLREVMHQTEH